MEDNQKSVTQTEPVNTEEKTEGAGTEPVEKTEKTYTQDEFNAFDKKLREKYEKKYEGIDLKKYKEWEESQKTEAQKQTELTQQITETKQENEKLKQKLAVANADVSKEFRDFVRFTVSEMEGDFEDNLEDFLKSNPKYLQTSKDVETPQSNGVATKKISNNADDGVTAILKAKHPDIDF